MKRTFLCFSVASSLIVAAAQGHGRQQQTQNVEDVGGRILRNDAEAIRAAFDGGDPRFIPYLKRALQGVKPDGSSRTWEESGTSRMIQGALVKLDDTETEQALWCWLIRVSPVSEVGGLREIGGWFSIQAIDAILGGAGKTAFETAIKGMPSTDVPWNAPSTLAVAVLPNILNEGPPPTNRTIATWRAWIAGHRETLKTLKPSGEGVSFTESACQNGKPK